MRRTSRAALSVSAAFALLLPVSALAVGRVTDSSSAAAAPALATGVTQRAIFTDPRAAGGKDHRIIDEWIRLFDAAPAGATADFTAYQLNTAKFTDAVIRAHKRGVKVRFLYNGDRDVEPEARRLRAAIGSSFLRCSGGCISARSSGYLHSKIFLLSASGSSRNVVVLSSQNPSNGLAGWYNDAVITTGDAELFARYRNVVNDMWAQNKNNDYGATSEGRFAARASLTQSWISPRADSYGGTREQPSTDTIVQVLRPLAGGAGCRVLMAQSVWDSSRDIIVKELARVRRNGGCDVRVVHGRADATTVGKLRDAGVPVRRITNPYTHQKVVLVEGTYNGAAGTRIVFSGGHNADRGSLREADDVFVGYRNPAIVDAYKAQHAVLWSRAS